MAKITGTGVEPGGGGIELRLVADWSHTNWGAWTMIVRVTPPCCNDKILSQTPELSGAAGAERPAASAAAARRRRPRPRPRRVERLRTAIAITLDHFRVVHVAGQDQRAMAVEPVLEDMRPAIPRSNHRARAWHDSRGAHHRVDRLHGGVLHRSVRACNQARRFAGGSGSGGVMAAGDVEARHGVVDEPPASRAPDGAGDAHRTGNHRRRREVSCLMHWCSWRPPAAAATAATSTATSTTTTATTSTTPPPLCHHPPQD